MPLVTATHSCCEADPLFADLLQGSRRPRDRPESELRRGKWLFRRQIRAEHLGGPDDPRRIAAAPLAPCVGRAM